MKKFTAIIIVGQYNDIKKDLVHTKSFFYLNCAWLIAVYLTIGFALVINLA